MDIKEFARMGGKARQASMTSQQRKQLAIKAINKRWNKKDTSKLVSCIPQDYWCIAHKQPLTSCNIAY